MGKTEVRIGVGDANKLVILGDTLGAREGTSFNLTGAKTDSGVGD